MSDLLTVGPLRRDTSTCGEICGRPSLHMEPVERLLSEGFLSKADIAGAQNSLRLAVLAVLVRLDHVLHRITFLDALTLNVLMGM